MDDMCGIDCVSLPAFMPPLQGWVDEVRFNPGLRPGLIIVPRRGTTGVRGTDGVCGAADHIRRGLD